MRLMRAFRQRMEVVTVNPILESISNNVSAMPAITQTPSGQRGASGFASTLAAAQDLAAVPETAGRAGSANSLNVAVPASGNPQSKKPSGGTLTRGSKTSASNSSLSAAPYAAPSINSTVVAPAVVPESNPAALSQIPSPPQPPGPVALGFGSTSRSAALSYSASSHSVTNQISPSLAQNGRALNLVAPNVTAGSVQASIQVSPNQTLLNQTAASPTGGDNGSLSLPEQTLSGTAGA